jgi:hypothetical protein
LGGRTQSHTRSLNGNSSFKQTGTINLEKFFQALIKCPRLASHVIQLKVDNSPPPYQGIAMFPNLEILDAPAPPIWTLASIAINLPRGLKHLTLRKASDDDVHQFLISLLEERDRFVPRLLSLTLDLHFRRWYPPPYLHELQSTCTERGISLFVEGGPGLRHIVTTTWNRGKVD